MAISLANARNLTQDKLAQVVIDEFRKSPLMEAMVFDDNVSTGGGSTLKYVYNRITTMPTAAFREINKEYTAQEAQTTAYTVELKPFGGSFGIDRVIQNDVRGITNQLELQLNQKIQATIALFNDTFINGDSATDTKAFDGLDKALADSSTEIEPATAIDLSSSSAIDSHYKEFLDTLNKLLGEMDGTPTGILVSKPMKAVINSIATRSGYFSTDDVDAFGRPVTKYAGIPFMEMGDKPGTAKPIISIDETTGTTSLYVVRIGLDGVHAVTPDGSSIVKTYLPDFNAPGAVKTGEVEMVAAMALKASRAAGVLANIQINPKKTTPSG